MSSEEQQDAARRAAAAQAAELIPDQAPIGLGSGRAVWAVMEALGERAAGLEAVCASSATEEKAREAGMEVIELDGEIVLSVAIDGADEIDPSLGLLKGGGGALLREKIVIAAAERFVCVAETGKRVDRLGDTRGLPVEVVRFGAADTRRRLLDLVESAELRRVPDGAPYVTDEGHHILDCGLPSSGGLAELGEAIGLVPGVVEHGLFIGMTSLALLGTPDGGVERLEP